MDLKKKLGELEQQLEIARSSFFQIQGAISIVKEQIKEATITSAPSEVKETKTDGAKK